MKLGTINDFINKMSLREKVLLVFTIAAVASMVLDMALVMPIETKRRAVSSKITSFQQQMAEISQRLSTLGGASESSGELAKVGDLKAEEKQIGEQLQAYQMRLPQSEQSLSLLNSLVYPKQPDVELIALKNIPPSELESQEDQTEKSKGLKGKSKSAAAIGESKSNKSTVPGASKIQNRRWYRHGLVLRVQGPFDSVLEYIRSLENASWHLAWETMYLNRVLSNRDQKEQSVEMAVEAYTISDQPHWLQVHVNGG